MQKEIYSFFGPGFLLLSGSLTFELILCGVLLFLYISRKYSKQKKDQIILEDMSRLFNLRRTDKDYYLDQMLNPKIAKPIKDAHQLLLEIAQAKEEIQNLQTKDPRNSRINELKAKIYLYQEFLEKILRGESAEINLEVMGKTSKVTWKRKTAVNMAEFLDEDKSEAQLPKATDRSPAEQQQKSQLQQKNPPQTFVLKPGETVTITLSNNPKITTDKSGQTPQTTDQSGNPKNQELQQSKPRIAEADEGNRVRIQPDSALNSDTALSDAAETEQLAIEADSGENEIFITKAA